MQTALPASVPLQHDDHLSQLRLMPMSSQDVLKVPAATLFCHTRACVEGGPRHAKHVRKDGLTFEHLSSQAGVMGLTKTVAREFAGRNILCNAVAPGFVASDMTAAIDPKYEAQILSTIPLGAPCPCDTPTSVRARGALFRECTLARGGRSVLQATPSCAGHEGVQFQPGCLKAALWPFLWGQSQRTRDSSCWQDEIPSILRPSQASWFRVVGF